MKKEINLWRAVDFLLSIETAKSRVLSDKVDYVGVWVAWVTFLSGLRGLRGLNFFFAWIIIFTWFKWVEVFCMGQIFLWGSKFFEGEGGRGGAVRCFLKKS